MNKNEKPIPRLTNCRNSKCPFLSKSTPLFEVKHISYYCKSGHGYYSDLCKKSDKYINYNDSKIKMISKIMDKTNPWNYEDWKHYYKAVSHKILIALGLNE